MMAPIKKGRDPTLDAVPKLSIQGLQGTRLALSKKSKGFRVPGLGFRV